MLTQQIVIIAAVLLFGAIVQGAAGFGLGLVAVPLLVLCGVSLPESIVLAMIATVVQTGWSCYQHKADIDWRGTIPIFVARVISLPLGIATLAFLIGEGPARAKQAIGIMLLLVVVAQWTLKIKPRDHVGPGWTAAAGLLSGWMGGLSGMGGPPVVLWVMAHDWSAQRARTFLWVSNLQITPLIILMLAWNFPAETKHASLVGLAMVPPTLLGTVAGAWLGSHLSRQRLRQVAYSMLLVVAAFAIIGPMS